MNATALSFVLVAAVVHAGWNLAAKRISSGGPQFVWLYNTVSAVALLPVTIVPLVTGSPQWTWLLAAAVTSALHVAYGIVLQRGYVVGDLSVVYPVARGTGPLLSVLAAVTVLGERPGWIGVLGAALVVTGVLVISTGRPHGEADLRARRAGIAYGLLTGAVIAAYTLWDAHSVTGLQVPPVVYFGLGAVLQSLMLVPTAITGRAQVARLWREQRREVLIVGLASPVAYILVLFALTMAPVSLVAPARELSIVLGGLAAWLVLGEQDAVRRLAGSVIVVAGIAAIAAA